jgi:type IV pilus assembly protein PilF
MLSLVVLAAALHLTGCGTPASRNSDEPGKARKFAETNTSLGRQYMDRGQYEVALEKLKRAVAYDKTYAPAHTLLGVLYETLGQQDEALEEYRRAVHYDPTDGDVNNNYAVFLCGQDKSEEADRYFQIAMKDPFYSTPEVVYANAGLCALGTNDLDKAERYLRQSLEYDAEFAPALLPMADLNYRNGDFLRARAFLQRFEAVGTSDAQSLFLGYRIEYALGDATTSARYKQDLLSKFPDSTEAAQAREQH